MPITMPLLWALFIRRTPWWAALFSIGCGLIVSGIAFFEVPLTVFGFSQEFSDSFEWNYQQQFFGVFGAATFGFLLSTLFAPARDSEHRLKVDKFFKTVRTPIDFDAEVCAGNDLSRLKVIGLFGAAVAVFVALLLIIPNPIESHIAILALAVSIGVVSALMIRAGMKSDRSVVAEEVLLHKRDNSVTPPI